MQAEREYPHTPVPRVHQRPGGIVPSVLSHPRRVRVCGTWTVAATGTGFNTGTGQ